MSVFIWYLVLFAPQLAIGAAIGWLVCLRHVQNPAPPDALADVSEQREQELRLAYDQLKLLTDSVQEDVREHAQKVDSSSRELADLSANGQTPDAGTALQAIAPIVQANEVLQRRLRETEEKLAEQAEKLELQTVEARTDPLTGLLNRRGMESEFPQLFEDYDQLGRSFCVTILDIDHFKKFNDTYGHDVGDVVLCEVARVVAGTVRRQDTVARFGGEEFVILSPDTELPEAGKLLEKVRVAVEDNVVREEAGDLSVTISLGLAQVMGGENSAALLKRADVALYAAKENSRNRTYFHDGEAPQPVVVHTPSEKPAEPVGRGGDVPTALPGRDAFADELSRRLDEAAGHQHSVAMVAIEIDRLENIAAQHGEATANLVRKGVAMFLQEAMRERDFVARNGTDGFHILLPDCTLEGAYGVAERVRRAAAETPFRINDGILQVTLSTGVAVAGPAETADQLMARGQAELNKALAAGGDRTSVAQGQAPPAGDDSPAEDPVPALRPEQLPAALAEHPSVEDRADESIGDVNSGAAAGEPTAEPLSIS